MLLLHHVQGKIGDIDDDIARSEMLWEPAPAIQIHGDLLHTSSDGNIQGRQSGRTDDAVDIKPMLLLKPAYRLFHRLVKEVSRPRGLRPKFAGDTQPLPENAQAGIPISQT